MLQNLCNVLQQRQIPFDLHVPMSRYTTLRVGGPADCFVNARNAQDVFLAVQAAQAEQIPYLVIGNGSNLLVCDEGIRGLVIAIRENMQSIRNTDTFLQVDAGMSLSAVAQFALQHSLSGLEALSGIPGTIGGTACMNAGAYGSELAMVVHEVQVMDGFNALVTLPIDRLAYGYRTSALMTRQLTVLQVTLSLTPGDPAKIRADMQSFAAKRREKQPLSMPSAGSFFKRPEGHFAGALIDQAGLRGFSIGGAQVSEKHAGFLVNTGNATASDFLALMSHIQEKVQQMSGILLEPEVRILGCNSYC